MTSTIAILSVLSLLQGGVVEERQIMPEPQTSIAERIEWQEFEATFYCSCEKCCGKSNGITASGEKAVEGITIAADISVLPMGTEVFIAGYGVRTVQDTGGAIKGNKIDIYMDSHKKCLEHGRKKIWLYVRE